MSTLLSTIKEFIGVESDELVYDKQIDILVRAAIGSLKMAGIDAPLGTDGEGRTIYVGQFRVGHHKVGEIIMSEEANEKVIEYLGVYTMRRLYQEAQTSMYETLKEREHELLVIMTYTDMILDI